MRSGWAGPETAQAEMPTNLGPDSDYVWGTLVADVHITATSLTAPASAFAKVQPGDVIQFRNVVISDSGWTYTFSHHSALIVGVEQSNGVNDGTVTVLEQNVNGQHFASEETYNLAAMTAGEVWIYQPMSATS